MEELFTPLSAPCLSFSVSVQGMRQPSGDALRWVGRSGKCNIGWVAGLFPSYPLAEHCYGVKQEIYSSGNTALGAQPVCVQRHLAAIQSTRQLTARSGNMHYFVYVQTTDFLLPLFPCEGRQGDSEPGETHIFKPLCQGAGLIFIFLDSSAACFSLSFPCAETSPT